MQARHNCVLFEYFHTKQPSGEDVLSPSSDGFLCENGVIWTMRYSGPGRSREKDAFSMCMEKDAVSHYKENMGRNE